MKDKELKFWSGDTQFTDQARVWPAMTIVAYSQRDAAQLYVQVGGSANGALAHVREYMGNAGGDAFHTRVPNPSRGVYFYDDGMGYKNRHRKQSPGSPSVMFIPADGRSIIEDIPEDAKLAAAGQVAPDNYGRLHVGFERGVKVDVWTFASPHADRALADRMTATVHLERSRRRVTLGEDGMEFVARSEVFGRGADLRNTNIQKLFEMVQEAFRTYEIGQRGVIWEDWLKIEVHRQHIRKEDHGAGFHVEYEIIKRGLDPRSGRALTITNNDIVTDFPKPKAPGKVKRQRSEDDDDWNMGDEQQVAFLPATPENIAALDKIITAIDNARAKLELLLVQESIASTLASIPTVPLLETKVDG